MLYANLQEYSYVCQSDVVKALCQDIEDNYGIHVLALDFNVGLVSAACRPTRSSSLPTT